MTFNGIVMSILAIMFVCLCGMNFILPPSRRAKLDSTAFLVFLAFMLCVFISLLAEL